MKTTDAFTRGQDLIDTILRKMHNINKWQQGFMEHIFILCLSMGGRFNFLQMGREGQYHEQSYRNNFSKYFDFLRFNIELVNSKSSGNLIIAFDPSYIRKSGKYTPGMGYFYSGCAGQYKKGLEIGGIAAVDIKQNTAYHLEAIQTPSAKRQSIHSDYTLVDHYADLIISKSSELGELSHILVADGYFAKYKFVQKVSDHTELTIVSRLRDDANLKYLYHGPKSKKRGRPKMFRGKVDTKNIDKRRFRKVSSNDERIIYGAVVFSVSLKRKIKVAFVEFLDVKSEVALTKLFFSTDLSMNASDILRYYKARYQIEFLYRDSKQFTGLEHCQSRSEDKLHFHFNTCLTAVSIGKVISKNGMDKNLQTSHSIHDVKTELRNSKMIKRIFSMYGFDPYLIKNHSAYYKLLNFGKIAA